MHTAPGAFPESIHQTLRSASPICAAFPFLQSALLILFSQNVHIYPSTPR